MTTISIVTTGVTIRSSAATWTTTITTTAPTRLHHHLNLLHPCHGWRRFLVTFILHISGKMEVCDYNIRWGGGRGRLIGREITHKQIVNSLTELTYQYTPVHTCHRSTHRLVMFVIYYVH